MKVISYKVQDKRPEAGRNIHLVHSRTEDGLRGIFKSISMSDHKQNFDQLLATKAVAEWHRERASALKKQGILWLSISNA
jgi:hypothetical protein